MNETRKEIDISNISSISEENCECGELCVSYPAGMVDHVIYTADDWDDAERFLSTCSKPFDKDLQIKWSRDLRRFEVKMETLVIKQDTSEGPVEVVTDRIAGYSLWIGNTRLN